jgi:hypothetical protein
MHPAEPYAPWVIFGLVYLAVAWWWFAQQYHGWKTARRNVLLAQEPGQEWRRVGASKDVRLHSVMMLATPLWPVLLAVVLTAISSVLVKDILEGKR